MDELRFDGRVAIVTGAGNGMGRDFAMALARQGASVVVNDLGVSTTGTGASDGPAQAVVDAIRASGGIAVASCHDAASAQGGQAIAQTALDAYGRIDILINNAAIMRQGAFGTIPANDLEAVIKTNLFSGFYVTQPCFEAMKRNSYGRILFISSNAATTGASNVASYAASKAGQIGLMQVVALEGEPHGIIANALLPGAVTRMSTANAEREGSPIDRKSGQIGDGGDVDRAYDVLGKAMTCEFVTPMALFLSSETCRETQSVFSAIAGRYSQTFSGTTSGWLAPDEAPPSAQAIADHMGRIGDRQGYAVPHSVADDLMVIVDARKHRQASQRQP